MSLAAEGFDSSPFFQKLSDGLKDEAIRQKAIKGVNAVIVITLKDKDDKEQSWVLDLKKDGTITKADTIPKFDCQLILKDTDFVKLAEGKTSGQKLFMSGKLRVKGNIMKATAIESVFHQLNPRPKL